MQQLCIALQALLHMSIPDLYDLQRIEYSLHDFEWLLHELMSAELVVETVVRA